MSNRFKFLERLRLADTNPMPVTAFPSSKQLKSYKTDTQHTHLHITLHTHTDILLLLRRFKSRLELLDLVRSHDVSSKY